VPVYHPGTTSAGDASAVTVSAGEETSGVNLALQYVRTARIAGSIAGADGFPEKDLRVTLIPAVTSSLGSGGSATSSVAASLRLVTTVGPDRTFAFNGIPPGRYTVMAQGIERPALTPEQSFVSVVNGVMALWAATEVVVEGLDVSGLSLTMRPGQTVSGRVQFDATAAGVTPPPDMTRVRVQLTSLTRAVMSVAGSFPSASVNAAGEFSLKGVLPGRYRLGASYANDLANGWSASAAMLNGRDVLDVMLDVPIDDAVGGLAITMTRATQSVTGVVQDASGRPAPGLTVVLFPSDRALWSVGRRLRSARSGQDGRYTIANIPSGEYRLAALTDLNPAESSNPAFLEQLVPGSIPIAVKAGDRKVQDLRVVR
jgi:5-hydroxyisourate hydrolase-like protein (transthyretin family)